MPDYQKMYYIMCDAGSKALDALPDDVDAAMKILQAALEDAEELYIQTCRETEQQENASLG